MIIQFKNFHDSLNIVAILAPTCEFFFAKCVQFPFFHSFSRQTLLKNKFQMSFKTLLRRNLNEPIITVIKIF